MMDLYRDMCNKLGKAKVWSLNADELLDEVEFIVEEKIKQAKQDKKKEMFDDIEQRLTFKEWFDVLLILSPQLRADFKLYEKLKKKHLGKENKGDE